MHTRRYERKNDVTIFKMSPTLTKLVLVGLTLLSIGSIYFNFSLFNTNLTLNYQLSEEGVTTIIHEIDEINSPYVELKIQYENLLGNYEILEEKNRDLLVKLHEAELEYITVTGVIINRMGRDAIGEISRTPIAIKFESSTGELIAQDTELDSGRYSVNLENQFNYIVKIKYTTRLGPSWVVVDDNYRLESDTSIHSKNW